MTPAQIAEAQKLAREWQPKQVRHGAQLRLAESFRVPAGHNHHLIPQSSQAGRFRGLASVRRVER